MVQFLNILFYFSTLILLIILAIQFYISIPRKYRKTYSGNPQFRTLVMIPCRGVDFSLEENLQSLLHQDYPNYDTVAIVDSEDDPSVDYLKKLGINYLISDYESDGSGKVRALSTALSRMTGYDAFVIADSDIITEKDWLINLLRPLNDSDYGISTTFPYFNPEGGFWSHFKTAWGLVGQGMMESDLTVFGWGGSLAFRKELLEDRESMDDFSSDISDDMALTRICLRKSMKIAYVKEAMVTIKSPDNRNVFMEWSLRQTSLLISRKPAALKLGILLYGSECLLILASIPYMIFFSPFYVIFLLPAFVSVVKAYTRIRKKEPVYMLTGLIMPFFYTWNLAAASRIKEISWRGRNYRL